VKSLTNPISSNDREPRVVITSGTGVAWTMKMVVNGPLNDEQLKILLGLEDKYIIVVVARELSVIEAP